MTTYLKERSNTYNDNMNCEQYDRKKNYSTQNYIKVLL